MERWVRFCPIPIKYNEMIISECLPHSIVKQNKKNCRSIFTAPTRGWHCEVRYYTKLWMDECPAACLGFLYNKSRNRIQHRNPRKSLVILYTLVKPMTCFDDKLISALQSHFCLWSYSLQLSSPAGMLHVYIVANNLMEKFLVCIKKIYEIYDV